MGFLDSLVDTRLITMSDSELKQEWNKHFGNRSLDDPPNTDYLRKLDQKYGEVFGRLKTWQYRSDKDKEEAKEKKLKKDLKSQENKLFAERIKTNPMVMELTDSLNRLSYDAYYIEVFDDCVRCLNDSKKEELVFRYKKYGYPNLDNEKMAILCKYLLRTLKLTYRPKSSTLLELNDAPGGMKAQW